MKKINLMLMLFIASFGFFSCSNTDDAEMSTDFNKNLLKNYAVKRDASGAYSIDFNVNEKVKVDKVVDKNTNSSQFYLYSADKNSQTNIAESLLIDENQLKVGFIDTNSDKKTNITVFDNNITFAKGTSENSKLNSYSITKNDEGLFEVAFDVKENVAVNFIYSEENEAYEIHLESGVATETSFTRTLEKITGKPLKVVFVNHVGNTGAKSAEALEPIRKPVIIIDEED